MITIEIIHPELNKSVEINANRQLGATAAVWVQERARKLNEYSLPVDCRQIGKDSSGNEIAVNTLGRWLFGVPGYDGHIRVVPEDGRVTIYYPSEPGAADALFVRLKAAIEGKEV